MDLRTVVYHVKVAIWIDLDGDQVGVNAGTTLGEIDASSSARNGFDLHHSSITVCASIPLVIALQRFSPKASATKTSPRFPSC